MTWPYEGTRMTLFTLYTLNHTVYSLHCTLYTVHCTLYPVHCTLYTVNCTLYTVHCILYTAHCRKIQWTEYIWGAQDDGVYVSQENCSLFLDDSAWLTVHCSTVLFSAVQYCAVLCYSALYCTALYCTSQHCTILYWQSPRVWQVMLSLWMTWGRAWAAVWLVWGPWPTDESTWVGHREQQYDQLVQKHLVIVAVVPYGGWTLANIINLPG